MELQPVHLRMDLLQERIAESGAHTSSVGQLPLDILGQVQGSESRAPPFGVGKTHNDEVLGSHRADLVPLL